MIKNTPYSGVVIMSALDGDLQTIIKGVAYSTSPREIITVGDVENYYQSKEDDKKID